MLIKLTFSGVNIIYPFSYKISKYQITLIDILKNIPKNIEISIFRSFSFCFENPPEGGNFLCKINKSSVLNQQSHEII